MIFYWKIEIRSRRYQQAQNCGMAGAGGIDLLGKPTIPRVQRKEQRQENAANMQRLHEIRAEFEKLAPVIARCFAGHLPTADYDAVAMQVLREGKVPAGWGAFVRIEDGGAVVVDERRAADFFQKNNNYEMQHQSTTRLSGCDLNM